MQLLEEQNLINECAEGNFQKFGGLYDFYADKIYRFIYFRVRHKETVQDLTSQTFFKALENIKSFDSAKGRFSSWLYRIAKNNVIDHYRKQKNHLDIDNFWDLKTEENLEYDMQVKEKISNVKECLKNLNKEQREIIMMRIWDGLSHKEISEILGKSEPSVKMSFSRALRILKKEEILAMVLMSFLISSV